MHDRVTTLCAVQRATKRRCGGSTAAEGGGHRGWWSPSNAAWLTPLEVDAQLKPPLIGIEGGLHDTPRRHEPERLLEKIDIAHRRILAHSAPSSIAESRATHTI